VSEAQDPASRVCPDEAQHLDQPVKQGRRVIVSDGANDPAVADVARMAWTDLAGNAINVVQAKTGARLTIPLHPNLSAALRAWPRKHVVMLTTAFNKPFTNAGYGNMMADAIAAAGLPDRCGP
jgi:hypothetical protein